MDPLDFLDKQAQQQVQILRFLIRKQRLVSIDTLLDAFSLSTPTIQKAVTTLKEKLSLFDERATLLVLEKTQLQLSLPDTFDLRAFLYESYYAESIDIHLIDQLYLTRELSITKLTFDLQVSEASIFRRLKKLNQLLADFDVHYKNKELVGRAEDLQLFYYSFYMQIYPIKYLAKRFYRESFLQLLTIFESVLIIQFTPIQKTKLMIWLSVMERLLDIRITHRYTKLPDIFFDSRFNQLEQVFLRFSSRYAMQWPKEAISWFYLFLQAEGILPLHENLYHQWEKMVTNLLTILKVTTKEERMIQHLMRIHLYIAYQKMIWQPQFLGTPRLSDTQPDQFHELMEEVEAWIPSRLNTLKWEYLDHEYARIHAFNQQPQQQEVHLTYALMMNDYFLQAETKQLLTQLSQQLKIKLRDTDCKHADLLITTETFELNETQATVYLSVSKWTTYDKDQLIQLLTTLKRQKGVDV